MKPPYNTHVFEMSWEVCNKVGGIYTVIESKLHEAMRAFSHYTLVGTANEKTRAAIEPETPPEAIRKAQEELKPKGINLLYGTAKDEPHPKVLLIDYLGMSQQTNAIKTKLWDVYGIDSLGSAWNDFDEVMLWAWCGGMAIEVIARHLRTPALLHAHEWMAGISVLYLKQQTKNQVATVFTSHATMLGRSLAGHGENLYQIEKSIDPVDFAYRIGVATKHLTERAIAHNADCFTTVSDITAEEARYFFGVKPQVLLYNGFDNRGIEDIEKLNARYFRNREAINSRIAGIFHDFYDLDPDEYYLFYTSGRNEMRNKGTDILIKSLASLKEELPKKNKKVICLFFLLIGEFEKNPAIMDSLNHHQDPNRPKGMLEYAPLSTHLIPKETEVMQQLQEQGLNNRYDDPVKVLIIPSYLDGNDGIFDHPYYQLITGTDLGIFPSFYEPWGYTPLESISYGVPTITSDLAGFGQSITETCGSACPSTMILKRRNKDEEKVTKELTKIMDSFLRKPQKTLLIERSHAKALAAHYDWQHFYASYLKAYQYALSHHK